MREVIVVGTASWVAQWCEEWCRRLQSLAAELSLAATLEPATDPFFGPGERGRRLIQQLKVLKRELRVPFDAAPLALASVNRHETFFSSRFGFELRGGEPAETACVAFGLERWTLAFLQHRGADAAAALMAGAAGGTTS